jgi:hypothetical protein
MIWQQNLISALIVIFILASIFIILYCKMKDISLIELFHEIKEILSGE